MRFESPHFLWLLAFVPLIALYAAFFRSQDIPTFRFSSLKHLLKSGGTREWNVGLLVMGGLRAAAITFLVIALARPQKGLRSEETTTKATDIMICLDTSRSMLAIDFKPSNRFEVAKNVISDFVKGRDQDRLGLVVFAEYAVTQCPLTSDRSALLTILDGLHIGVIPPDQTAVGVGLATSVNRIKTSKAKSKVIILVTDGANNAGSIDPVTAAKSAHAFGIKVYTIGAGSPGETAIPIDGPMGRQMVPIKSDLNEDELLKIASETGGKYFRAANENALTTIFKEIDSMEKTDIKVKEFLDYKEMYIGFLLIGVALLLIELSLSKTLYRTLP